MAQAVSRSPEPPQGWRRLARWWGWAGVFVLGLLVGGIIVGLLNDETVVPPSATDGGATTSAPVSSAPQNTASPGATGQVVLGEDCLRAINAAQDLVGLVDDLAEALADFNAARLDEIVRELQPLQDRLRGGVDECNVRATIATGSGGSGSTTPAPTSAATTS